MLGKYGCDMLGQYGEAKKRFALLFRFMPSNIVFLVTQPRHHVRLFEETVCTVGKTVHAAGTPKLQRMPPSLHLEHDWLNYAKFIFHVTVKQTGHVKPKKLRNWSSKALLCAVVCS